MFRRIIRHGYTGEKDLYFLWQKISDWFKYYPTGKKSSGIMSIVKNYTEGAPDRGVLFVMQLSRHSVRWECRKARGGYIGFCEVNG